MNPFGQSGGPLGPIDGPFGADGGMTPPPADGVFGAIGGDAGWSDEPDAENVWPDGIESASPFGAAEKNDASSVVTIGLQLFDRMNRP